MRYDYFNNLCWEALEDEDYNCLYIDRFKNQSGCDDCICNGKRPETFFEWWAETNLFQD